MTKAELILKAIMTPGEPVVAFVENYIRLVPDHDLDTFRMVIEMKGFKKSDINLYVEVFKSKLSQQAAAAAKAAAAAAAANTSTNSQWFKPGNRRKFINMA